MRVLVSVDMEGIAGVVHSDDIQPGHSEYERNRALLTEEANTAVRGVYAYEPDAQVLVTDAHAQFRNLLPELLDQRAELLRGTPRPNGMMAGLATDIDAVLFVGYHGKAGTLRGPGPHHLRPGHRRCAMQRVVPWRLGLNTALAAHHGVPAVLVSGDDTVATEAAEVAPGIHCVVVKRALGGRAAASTHPLEACQRIEHEVPRALADRAAVRPRRVDGPVRLEVQVHRPHMSELASESMSQGDRERLDRACEGES